VKDCPRVLNDVVVKNYRFSLVAPLCINDVGSGDSQGTTFAYLGRVNVDYHSLAQDQALPVPPRPTGSTQTRWVISPWFSDVDLIAVDVTRCLDPSSSRGTDACIFTIELIEVVPVAE
jgi:hypothetical protein